MSLKAFHIIFIIISVILFVSVAVWALVLTTEQSTGVKVLGIASVICATGLSVYGVYFVKKAKNIIV